MDPTQSADAREPNPTIHRYTKESDGSQLPTAMEDNNSPGERDVTNKTTPQSDTGFHSGKGDDTKSQPDARRSHNLSLASVGDDETMDEMDTPLSQRDEASKPEMTPASPKRPK
jgi:hypothetical protein